MIDVNLLDDHSMFTDGLTAIFNKSDKAQISRVFSTIDGCRAFFAGKRPDILLLDISLPNGNGIDFCKEVVEKWKDVKIIALSSHNEYSLISRMVESGAQGYMLKSSSINELLQAVIAVYEGGSYICEEAMHIMKRSEAEQVSLTSVERKILKLLCDGLTNSQIADRICLSTETVNWYRKRLLTKFDVKNSASLIAHVVKSHIL